MEFFQQVFNLIEREEHLTPSGLRKIIAIKAAMNRGLSKKLKSEFKNIKPADRPEVIDKKIKDPNRLAGFTTGEGCFLLGLKEKNISSSIRV